MLSRLIRHSRLSYRSARRSTVHVSSSMRTRRARPHQPEPARDRRTGRPRASRQLRGAWSRSQTGAEYVNFPGRYEGNDRMVRGTFGANLDRLVALKQRYDPTNLFHLNHNIRPD